MLQLARVVSAWADEDLSDRFRQHAVDDIGQTLWRHHVGSTVSAIDITQDGSTIMAASYGGYLVMLKRVETGMDPYFIGTSPYVEARRWIFWSVEAAPLRWLGTRKRSRRASKAMNAR